MKLLHVVLTILLNRGSFSTKPTKTNTELASCVSRLIQKVFSVDATIYFIFSDLQADPVPVRVDNPRIIVNIEDPIRMSSNWHKNYLIYTNDTSLNDTLNKLKKRSIWNVSESPRGIFLIVTSSTNLQDIFVVLWRHDIINSLVIGYSEESLPKLYTCNPFAKENNCGNAAKVIIDLRCDVNLMSRFNDTIKNMNGCSLSSDMQTASFDKITTTALAHRLLQFIGKTLNAVDSGFNFNDTKVDHYNYSAGILFTIAIMRGRELLANYDLSEILFRDTFVWALPKTNKLYDPRIISNIYKGSVWISIGIAFLVVLVTWWLMAQYTNDRTNYRQFWRSGLAILAIFLCGSDHLPPRTNALKFLALFYSIYCVLIYTSFNANLSSVLTKSRYAQGITSVKELSESGLGLLAVGKFNLSEVYNKKLFEELRKNMVPVAETGQRDILQQIVRYRNQSAVMSTTAIKVSGQEGRVDTIDARILSMEITLCMRKGHYFLPTFNKRVRLIYEHGFYQHITRAVQNTTKSVEKQSITPLKITHLCCNFIFWGAGLLLAMTAFIVELYWHEYFSSSSA